MEKSQDEIFPWCNNWGYLWLTQASVEEKFKNITTLHIDTNNTVNETSRTMLDELLSLKAFVEKTLPDCNACNSNLTLRTDNAKPSLTN